MANVCAHLFLEHIVRSTVKDSGVSEMFEVFRNRDSFAVIKNCISLQTAGVIPGSP